MVRTTYPRKDLFDMVEISRNMKAHNEFPRRIRDKFAEQEIRFRILSAGGCGYCAKCSAPDSPCRYPDERIFSIEAYGIDLTTFLMKNDIRYRCGNEEQSFFMMIFHH